ncbi:unnamed protein product (mitochondrion) [Plasmodiophora brassicae]|uniref:Uncharacterized protein n=1 Tax=Plasmodiophora brassicae TaxID=37360 RepID=A0A3P3YE83_PLABS|nr:unnamed protein product [Plasmodiophora brassicae]
MMTLPWTASWMFVVLSIGALLPTASSWITIRNESNGNALWSTIAPNYILANPSFNITARLYVVLVTDHADYVVPSQAAGCIIVVNYALAGSMYRWGQSCTRAQCAGIISHDGLTQGNDYQMAFSYWMHSKPFTTAPIVVIALGLSDRFRELVGSSPNLQATITSGDYNEVCTIVHSPFFIGVSAVGALLSIANVVVGVYKLVQMSLDTHWHLRAVPALPGFAIGFEILASVIRCVYLTDMAFFHAQGTSFEFQRYLVSSSIPFSFGCTTLVSVTMYECLHWDRQLSRPQRIKIGILALFAFAFVIFDQVVTVLSALDEHEYLNGAAVIGAIYFVVHIPIVIGFIIYGRRVAKSMTTAIKALDTESISRTRRFARRIAISGLVGAAALFVEVIFVITSVISIWGVLVGWMSLLSVNSATGFFHIVAFKSKPSCISIEMFSRKTTANPQIAPAKTPGTFNVVPHANTRSIVSK